MKITDGKIVLEPGDLEKLEQRGFAISMHTPYYTNGITADAHGFSFGFYSYTDNLEFIMSSDDVGYYSDSYSIRLKVNTEEDLEKCLLIMDSLLQLKSLNGIN